MWTLNRIQQNFKSWVYEPINLQTHHIFWNSKNVAIQDILNWLQNKVLEWEEVTPEDIKNIKSIITPDIVVSLWDDAPKHSDGKINPYKFIEETLFKTKNAHIRDIDFSKTLYKDIFDFIMTLESSTITTDSEETNKIAEWFKNELLWRIEALDEDDNLRNYILEAQIKWINLFMGRIYMLRKKIELQQELENKAEEVKSKVPDKKSD